jgi:hypothetical protein
MTASPFGEADDAASKGAISACLLKPPIEEVNRPHESSHTTSFTTMQHMCTSFNRVIAAGANRRVVLPVLGLVEVGTSNISDLFGSPYLEEAGDFV